MEELVDFVVRFGYPTLVLVGFAEFAGLPIVSVPVVVAAGALTVTTPLAPVPVALAAALGALAADFGWYTVGRSQGYRVVGLACSLSSNKDACVCGVEDRVSRLGLRLIVPSKFLPGVGNLLAPAAGFAGVPLRRFLPGDLVAVSLWAGVYTGLGVLFADQVQRVLEWMAAYRVWVVFVAGAAIGGAMVWRWARSRMHGPGHEAAVEAASGEDRVEDREEEKT